MTDRAPEPELNVMDALRKAGTVPDREPDLSVETIEATAKMLRARAEKVLLGPYSDELFTAAQCLESAQVTISELTRRNEELQAEKERAEFFMEAANTPMMRDVLKERDAALAQLSSLTEELEREKTRRITKADSDFERVQNLHAANAALTEELTQVRAERDELKKRRRRW